jgi:DNA-binding CsgD family transcriptional regulator/tetratricopeptide (TPR) repeat protein
LAADGATLVVGEGGVGKSALVTVAARASGRRAWAGSALAVMCVRRLWPLGEALGGVALSGDVEAVAAHVESVVGPDLLVVDDVHLADEATVDVLCALVHRVAVLAAARPDSLRPQAAGPNSAEPEGPVGRLTACGFEPISLAPLSDDQAAALTRALAPDLPESRISEVVVGAGGLPLLVQFLSGRDADAPLGRDLVPDIRGLSRPAFHSALRLSLSGAPMAADGSTQDLVAAGVAAVGVGGTVAIRHALVSDAVVAAAERSAVVQAHLDLAAAASDPAVAAQHWSAAGEAEQATAVALAEASESEALVDRARLLALAARCAPESARKGHALEAAAALSEAGLHAEVVDILDGIDGGLTEDSTQARACLLRARAQWHAGDSSAAVSYAREGLARVDRANPRLDPRIEASLLVALVRAEALSSGITEQHDAQLARAAELLGEGSGRAGLLSVVGIIEYLRDGGVDAWEAGRRAALLEGDVDSLMRCSNNVIMWHESVGDPGVGLELAFEMAADAEGRGLAEWRSQFQAMAANLLYHGGRYEQALTLLEAVESVALDPRTRRQAQICHASLLIDLGLLDAASALVPALPTSGSGDWMHNDSVHYLHAALAHAAGRPQRALSLIQQLSELGSSSGDILTFLLPVRAWAEHDLGLPVTVMPDPDHLPVVHGLVLEARGVALLAADPGAASTLLAEAADVGARWTFAPSLRARWGAAEALRLAGSSEAVPQLLAVEEVAAAAGLEPLLARVHRSLRLVGVARSARRAPDRSGLLTERERHVLDLVAGGATYAEIARRLGVGRPTVRRLLDNARTKLGTGNRVGAVAALAGR